MRFRLQTFFPVLIGLVVAAGFMLAAVGVGDAVREALLTVPGITRDRAVEAAVAAVAVAGVVVTGLAVVASALIARTVAGPLVRLRRSADQFTATAPLTDYNTFLGEVQDVGDSFNRVAGNLRARHEREQRERSELRELVDAVSEGILQVGADGRISRVNPAGSTLLGLPANAVGQPVSVLLRSASLRAVVEEALNGEPTPAAEIVLDDRRVLASVAPQEGGGAVGTFVDLTALRRLEEVRRDFVANASHELKTPLTSIRGYTDTLLAGDLDEEDRGRFLAIISRNADRLQRIVDDLLDLSRLESGRWRPEMEAVDANQLAQDAWRTFAERAVEQEVTFLVRPGTADPVLADRNALEQIFVNLFDNALRYTPPGGRIEVVTSDRADGPVPASGHSAREESRSEGRWIAIEVSDTGAGIPRDSVPRVFERFYRVDPARSREEGGTGLGLSIVRHLAESMGGAIRADSILGRGTTMTLWLRQGAAEEDVL